MEQAGAPAPQIYDSLTGTSTSPLLSPGHTHTAAAPTTGFVRLGFIVTPTMDRSEGQQDAECHETSMSSGGLSKQTAMRRPLEGPRASTSSAPGGLSSFVSAADPSSHGSQNRPAGEESRGPGGPESVGHPFSDSQMRSLASEMLQQFPILSRNRATISDEAGSRLMGEYSRIAQEMQSEDWPPLWRALSQRHRMLTLGKSFLWLEHLPVTVNWRSIIWDGVQPAECLSSMDLAARMRAPLQKICTRGVANFSRKSNTSCSRVGSAQKTR